MSKKLPNTAFTRTPRSIGAGGGTLRGRVSKQFSWLEVVSVTMTLSRPAHQQVKRAARRQP